ncbi:MULTISPECIES: Stp1/IreP family PP2C-type Ser/Thr phosphatase [Planktothricoides]|uniref:Stp1/IreP family PP2C-type Ser/Thr phosphatase n=2 Tax=Planktothricoides raciborskii TaxID=132608 RepID=A0AAU8JIS3_9CYAN|nr:MULTISPECIES: Stp1/IreP family PP2C-type Ser/Thr phosphatase [Planktothricoides]KOR33693.1 serine/threonine protein phosphatase [Planktothricoides sp. SR001]MBD2547948.1 Stp1/IreP family PP2C-type Ser/Thr phosphatase [Planktothricoides raciborskii FACHB-1370]MBD2586354.1 Stp1/IreP family PP2C-type Ser/Thr phosphatase [Planktothricoides raciborskii FACHB-1261]
MKRYFAGLTDTGVVRSVNQDDYYMDEPEGRFFIVADGMGGHAGGQEASRIAVQTIKNYLQNQWHSDKSSAEILNQAFRLANETIVQEQQRHPALNDMGTTAVAVIFRDDQPWCAHVGDSRLYRLRGSKLQQITDDHTWVARAIQAGHLTAEQGRSHPMRHVLERCIGRPDLPEVTVNPFEVQTGDRLLLCSDGLTEELSDAAIANNLKSIRAGEKAATTLVDAAKEKGGRDNITVVIITIA